MSRFFQGFPRELNFNILIHVIIGYTFTNILAKKVFGNDLVGWLVKYLIKMPLLYGIMAKTYPTLWEKLTKVLKGRYGWKTQVDKYKMELKARRRNKDETLEELHTDIRRLAVLTFPKMGKQIARI